MHRSGTLKALYLLLLAIGLNDSLVPSAHAQTRKNPRKELRYLFFANGGLVAYFDDGSVVGCPRCDFSRSNIWSLWDAKPHARYQVLRDGRLLVNGTSKESPIYRRGDPDGWALINYKWYIKPPQE
jgi:hypothetical protein